MNANALRRILLVKSVEDQDVDGAVLTLAEREAATRDALRAVAARGGAPPTGSDERGWRVLDARAAELYERLVQRHPVVARTVMFEAHTSQAAWATLLVAFVAGLALSVLDSRVRIEIVAFPLLGLVLWNLAVYAVLALAALRRRPGPRAARSAGASSGWIAWPLRWGWRRAASLVRQASFYHRSLAAALRRFSEEWWPFAQPLLTLQGKRIFHLAAAAVALGLVAGFYVRGIALEYRAGWESTFLTPAQVRGVLHGMYGPAAALTGIALPADDAAIEALRWRDGAGGGPAARWIHLIAATALLFVVLPRLLLAAMATVALAHASRRLVPPDSLLPYARNLLAGSDAAPAAVTAHVIPFAYHPDTPSLEGLQRLLQGTYGAGTRVDFGTPVAYGDEPGIRTRLAGASPALQVILFTLAATPESENHGAALTAARDALTRSNSTARLLPLVDESPYLAHMRGDASLAGRIEERREVWRSFAARHGCEVLLADLAAVAWAPTVPDELVDRLRAASRGERA
jgi:hypothetical protein